MGSVVVEKIQSNRRPPLQVKAEPIPTEIVPALPAPADTRPLCPTCGGSGRVDEKVKKTPQEYKRDYMKKWRADQKAKKAKEGQ
jgi:hypothetical protein